MVRWDEVVEVFLDNEVKEEVDEKVDEKVDNEMGA